MRMRNLRSAGALALTVQLSLAGAAVRAAPVISSFSPGVGRPGTQIVINGSGFSTATQVKFDTTIADFSASSDARMIATVPLNASSGQVRVTNPTGTGVSSGTFLVAPRISGFSPLRSATNTAVTLEGFNFAGATSVLFNTRPATFAVTAATQIQATVPTGATNGPITVQTPAGGATTTNSFVVTGPAPIIDDFSPAVGAPGVSVLINGANFSSGAIVKFNGIGDSTAAVTAPTQISAHVPATATTGKISVTTASGGTTTSSNSFFVTKAPVITNFFPAFGKAGTPVTLEGINFNNLTGIGFNGRSVSGWGTPAPNQITTTVPASAATGSIIVTNSFGVGISTNDFIVTSAPIISDFFPFIAAPGTDVVINGANFIGVPNPGGVKFNGRNAASVSVTADTQIHAVVPSGATTGPITITNTAGAALSASNFVVTGNGPLITEFSPDGGARGTEVIISGANFSSPVTVKFNGAVDSAATVTAATQIHSTVPPNATTGPIIVTTASGTSTNANIFYVPPRLSVFSPTNGVVGASVAVTGANFTGANGVLFNSALANFTVTASNTISAVVPTNATTGPLTVTAPGGVIISTNNFRVQPNIISFSPALGPVGTLVTILGTSFFNVTNVEFNGTSATNFTIVSSTEVRAPVPPGASTGPIRVSTPDGTAASASNFTVTGPSDLAVDLQASSFLMTQPGQQLTYTLHAINNGPSDVSGVVLTDFLPAGVDLVSATSTNSTCSVSNNTVVCTVPVLSSQGEFALLIVVVPPAEGVFVDSASLAAVEPENFPGNNTASVVTTVVLDASRTLRVDLVSTGKSAVISWPTSAVPFSLQFLNAFSASNNLWQPVTNSPSVLNGRNRLTNAAASGDRFFRLQKP